MNADTVNAISKALQPIADKLGQGAKVEWEAYYRQVKIDAWTTMFFSGLLLLLTLVVGLSISHAFNKRQHNEEASRYNSSDAEFGKWSARVITAIFSVIFLGWFVTGGIQPLLNPVYQVTHDIIGQLKKGN